MFAKGKYQYSTVIEIIIYNIIVAKKIINQETTFLKDDMSLIANSISYAERMPPDFSVVLMRDYMYIEEGYKESLLNIPEFSKWLSSKGGLLNGAVR